MFDNIGGFLNEFLKRLDEAGVDISGMEIDHLGYKTNSEEEYLQMEPEILKMSVQVHDNVVRGRRVRAFKLNNPIIYRNYQIGVIEIICPKEGEIIKSGWEHAEIVPKVPLQEFVNKYPNLEWDTTIMNANEFPMVKLKLGDDMQAKFPRYPILESIKQAKS